MQKRLAAIEPQQSSKLPKGINNPLTPLLLPPLLLLLLLPPLLLLLLLPPLLLLLLLPLLLLLLL
jgi:hypothetical protein